MCGRQAGFAPELDYPPTWDILRFTNAEVLGTTEAVVEEILRVVPVALRSPRARAVPPQ